MKLYEIKNNLEQTIPVHLPDGREIQLPPRNKKMSITLNEQEAGFFQIQQLRKSNLIRMKEKI